MNQALIGQRTYQVPGRFAELKPDQFVAVVDLLHAKLHPLDLKLRLTLVLLEVRHRPLLFNLWRRMSPEQRYELTQLAAFCLEEPRFSKQLLPALRIPSVRAKLLSSSLLGPSDGWGNLTFAEFIQAEGHFADYQRQPEVERHLNLFVATLYRPAGGKNPADPRQPYAQGDVAARAELVARLPLATRLAVHLWYGSCRSAYVRKYTGTIFTAPKEGDGTRRPDPREVWREILAERAGSPVHYEEYGSQVMPNIFFDLDLRIRRRAEQTPSK